ncbi:hypothetical protein K491DRAFT_713882 [Lophiostoma macrostomum CBS 122681]|uniref:Uncharacterized protein n=1 Tax=Lophiostoma macrostomum CBS 122681 TaxID=1314788 RepID=A0A6A6TDN8_9PLEO|nr:hypothetical protein K491DRAFT_713882 [Lophiostoma macrostomum CBS 122681]
MDSDSSTGGKSPKLPVRPDLSPTYGSGAAFRSTVHDDTVMESETAPAVQPYVSPYNADDSAYWINDPEKIKQVKDLKTLALANARLLYGSDRNRFFDVVTSQFDSLAGTKYGAFLVITVDGTTKPLRKEVNDCPLTACRALVARLHKDTGLLFMKFDVGDQISGQQGTRNNAGKFELNADQVNRRSDGPDDETRNMEHTYAPRGPRGDGHRYRGGGHGGYGSNKRARRDLDYN